MSPKKALERAVELAGGQAEVARKLTEVMGRQKKPVSQQQVWNWLFRNKGLLPAEFAIPLETVVQQQVKRSDFRPDLYPKEEGVVGQKSPIGQLSGIV